MDYNNLPDNSTWSGNTQTTLIGVSKNGPPDFTNPLEIYTGYNDPPGGEKLIVSISIVIAVIVILGIVIGIVGYKKI